MHFCYVKTSLIHINKAIQREGTLESPAQVLYQDKNTSLSHILYANRKNAFTVNTINEIGRHPSLFQGLVTHIVLLFCHKRSLIPAASLCEHVASRV